MSSKDDDSKKALSDYTDRELQMKSRELSQDFYRVMKKEKSDIENLDQARQIAARLEESRENHYLEKLKIQDQLSNTLMVMGERGLL